jgi:hypothetical protein
MANLCDFEEDSLFQYAFKHAVRWVVGDICNFGEVSFGAAWELKGKKLRGYMFTIQLRTQAGMKGWNFCNESFATALNALESRTSREQHTNSKLIMQNLEILCRIPARSINRW